MQTTTGLDDSSQRFPSQKKPRLALLPSGGRASKSMTGQDASRNGPSSALNSLFLFFKNFFSLRDTTNSSERLQTEMRRFPKSSQRRRRILVFFFFSFFSPIWRLKLLWRRSVCLLSMYYTYTVQYPPEVFCSPYGKGQLFDQTYFQIVLFFCFCPQILFFFVSSGLSTPRSSSTLSAFCSFPSNPKKSVAVQFRSVWGTCWMLRCRHGKNYPRAFRLTRSLGHGEEARARR